MTHNEGYIKFQSILTQSEPPPFEKIYKLNLIRTELFKLGLIGMYPDGIGFGNVSVRDKKNSFIISCTQTGGIGTLLPEHYVLVTDFDLEKNLVLCKGLAQPSSESMTHAAVYAANTDINVVLHIHNHKIWEETIDVIPTTKLSVEYGTPAMAFEVQTILLETYKNEPGIIIMGGHPDGIIIYGRNESEALEKIRENL